MPIFHDNEATRSSGSAMSRQRNRASRSLLTS